MSGEQLFEAMSGLDPTLVSQINNQTKITQKKINNFKQLLVACILLVLASITSLVFICKFAYSPNYDDVRWNENIDYGGEQKNDDFLSNFVLFEGIYVDSDVYPMLLNAHNNDFFAFVVTDTESNSIAYNEFIDKIGYSNIYVENANGYTLVFLRKKDFKKIKISDEQRKEYLFVWASKNMFI